MAAHQNRMLRVSRGILHRHKLAQHVEHLIACHGVESGGRLVQDEHLRVVRQGAGQAQLHAHTARQLFNRLLRIELEPMKAPFEHARVPGLIRAVHKLADLGDLDMRRHRDSVEHHADALLHRGVGAGQPARVDAQDPGIARIDADDAEQGLDGR